MDRRVLLRLFGVVGTAASIPAPLLDRMHEVADLLDRPGRVDSATLDALDELTTAYAAQYGIVPPDELAKLVTAHVDHAAARLDLPMAPALRARLGSITSEAAAMAGWLHSASGRRGQALTLLSFARDTARDAGNAAAHALALASLGRMHSHISRGQAGASPVARRHVDHGLALMPADAPAVQRAWLHGIDAGERAAAGDASAFAMALRQAGRVHATANDDVSGVWSARGLLDLWGDDAGIQGIEGFGAGVLGDPAALAAMERALAHADRPVSRSNLLHYAAHVHVVHGDMDEAARLAAEGVDLALDAGVLGRLDRFRGLREQMPADLPAARDLDERLAAGG